MELWLTYESAQIVSEDLSESLPRSRVANLTKVHDCNETSNGKVLQRFQTIFMYAVLILSSLVLFPAVCRQLRLAASAGLCVHAAVFLR